MSGADLAKDKEKADRTDEATVKASGPDKAGTEAAAKPAENPTIRQPSSERVLLARLFRYVRPHWRVFALGVVAMMLTGSTETALPAIMQHLLDDGFGGKGNPQLMWTAPLMIIGLFVGRGMFTFTMNYAMNEVSNSVLYDLRKQMFDRLVQMPVSYFSTHSAGTIIARLVNDVQNVTQSLASVLVIMVRDTCVILGLLGWLLYLNWQLTMIAFVLIPMVALAVGAFSRRMRRLSGEQLRYTGELTSVVGEAIHGNPVIKVYAGQEHERSRFAAASRQLQGFARRMTVASSLLVPITQVIERAKGALRFEDVRFGYEGSTSLALKGIDLEIKAGETVALVGGSGGGKTTLANLLPRFYSVTDGRILLDDIPIESLKLESLRRQIAWVSQQVMLFNDTIANNVAYGSRRGASEADVRAALDAAYLTEFVASLPDGINTMIGDNGIRLSGGQRQRLSIARALLKNAPILVLDEATSALDNESERFVQAALDKLMHGQTTLIIAHRLSTIEKADRILVLDDGRIVESGTHAELIELGGLYARLHAGGTLT